MDLNSPARIVAVMRRTQDFGAEEVAAYWEALFASGLIPPEYLPNHQRVFPRYYPNANSNFNAFLTVCAKDEAERGSAQLPPKVADAAVFACLDPALVLQAEQLARDATTLDCVRWRPSPVLFTPRKEPRGFWALPEVCAIEAWGIEVDGVVAGGVQLAYASHLQDSA